jgi:hypothetical protein
MSFPNPDNYGRSCDCGPENTTPPPAGIQDELDGLDTRVTTLENTNDVIVSSGDITALTTAQQDLINEGSIVVTTDGKRWVYSGAGSKVLEASYVWVSQVSLPLGFSDASSGTIDLRNYGGSIDLSGYGGSITLSGYAGNINTSTYGGAINTSTYGGAINTSGVSGSYIGGAINTSASSTHSGGSINTSAGSGTGAGGSINTSNKGGSLDLSGAGTFSGGSINLSSLVAGGGSPVNAPSILCGTGIPSSSAVNGSIYLRVDGTASTTLYVRAGGSWSALS